MPPICVAVPFIENFRSMVWPQVRLNDRSWLFGGCLEGSREGHFNDIWQMRVEEG